MGNHFLLVGITVVLLSTLLSGCFQNDSTDESYSSGQIWEIIDDQSGQTATLTVDSSGYFSGSDWVGGGSAGIPSYNIYITNGRMYSNSITFDAHASYNNGDGAISAIGVNPTETFPAHTPAPTPQQVRRGFIPCLIYPWELIMGLEIILNYCQYYEKY